MVDSSAKYLTNGLRTVIQKFMLGTLRIFLYLMFSERDVAT